MDKQTLQPRVRKGRTETRTYDRCVGAAFHRHAGPGTEGYVNETREEVGDV